MAEKFIMVWTIDDETMSMPHSTQDGALQRAEKLLHEHGCDLEIALHLDRISSPNCLQRSACFRRYSVLSVIGGWCTGRQSAGCIRLLTLRSSHCENQIRLLRVKPGPSLPGERNVPRNEKKGRAQQFKCVAISLLHPAARFEFIRNDPRPDQDLRRTPVA
jgi:hypothetical protein